LTITFHANKLLLLVLLKAGCCDSAVIRQVALAAVSPTR